MNEELLRQDLIRDEGLRLKPYRCTAGKLSIGVGRNLEDVGISKLEGEVLLDHDLHQAEMNATKAFEWFAGLRDIRQRAIVELVFNLGLVGFKGFRQTIAAIKAKQYVAASLRLLDSLWAKQVGPTRSQRIARYLRDGE